MFKDGSVNLVSGIMDSNYESRRRGQAGDQIYGYKIPGETSR